MTISNFAQALATFVLNNFPIEQVSSTKSLGVSIDENLSWNTHIETVCKKISSALGLIKRIRDFVPFHSFEHLQWFGKTPV